MTLLGIRISFIFILFWSFEAAPLAYGGSQAMNLIGAVAAAYAPEPQQC